MALYNRKKCTLKPEISHPVQDLLLMILHVFFVVVGLSAHYHSFIYVQTPLFLRLWHLQWLLANSSMISAKNVVSSANLIYWREYHSFLL